MSFNTIDLNTIKTETALGKENYKVDANATAPVKSRYPLMVYPNGMFDVSKMKGMHVSRLWEPSIAEGKEAYYYGVFLVLDDGTDYRISKKYLIEEEAIEELENYIRELWSIADDFEKHIPSFLK